MGDKTQTGATVPVFQLENGVVCLDDNYYGAGYVDYLQSPREDEWVLLHEQQAWGAWRNDATGHSWD